MALSYISGISIEVNLKKAFALVQSPFNVSIDLRTPS